MYAFQFPSSCHSYTFLYIEKMFIWYDLPVHFVPRSVSFAAEATKRQWKKEIFCGPIPCYCFYKILLLMLSSKNYRQQVQKRFIALFFIGYLVYLSLVFSLFWHESNMLKTKFFFVFVSKCLNFRRFFQAIQISSSLCKYSYTWMRWDSQQIMLMSSCQKDVCRSKTIKEIAENWKAIFRWWRHVIIYCFWWWNFHTFSVSIQGKIYNSMGV